MKKLITSAILTKYSPRKDRSVSLTFELNEQKAEEVAELHRLTGMYGGLVFKPENQLTKQEIEEIDGLEIELSGKTKSQRLRNVLFKLHQQEGGGDFNDFYAEKMESLISQIKNRLE